MNVRLSVLLLYLFSLFSHHRVIMKFSGVITNDRIEEFGKGQGQDQRGQNPT